MKNKNKIALLDFDDVLFHTKAFGEIIKQAFVKAGLTEREYEEIHQAFRDLLQNEERTYHQNEYISFVKVHFPKMNFAILLKELAGARKKAPQFVFADSQDFLDNLASAGWQKIVLSFGNNAWQKIKIRSSGIARNVDEIVVTQDPTKVSAAGEILKKYPAEKIIFIDDNPFQALNAVKNDFPQVTTIQLIRPEIQDRVRHPGCDHDCQSLDEIKEMILSL